MGMDNRGASPYTHHCAPSGQLNVSNRRVYAIHVAMSASTTSRSRTANCLNRLGQATKLSAMGNVKKTQRSKASPMPQQMTAKPHQGRHVHRALSANAFNADESPPEGRHHLMA